jgi:antagonist of KipI
MLEILEANALITVQDLGRLGWRRFGVPASGPMDAFAFQAANLLAGNSPNRAALEIGGGDVLFRATQDCVIAVAGAGYSLTVNVWEYPLWGSYFVRSGWTMRLGKGGFGMWAYLALAGGIEAVPLLGSRSTYLRGHFGGLGGRSLQTGDVLQGAAEAHLLMESAAQVLPAECRPGYGEEPTLGVIPGPQSDEFTDESRKTLVSSSYLVALSSDRMGYRLEGPPLSLRRKADLTSAMASEGITVGCIQAPADGGPIVMMADCATTGGYPKIACVIGADLPLLAQCTPGKDRVRFRRTTIEAAQQRYWELQERLISGIVKSEEYDR